MHLKDTGMDYIAKKSNMNKGLMMYSAFLAVIFGAIIAIFGGPIAFLLFAPILPIIFLLRDFRIGVVLLIFLLPIQHTLLLPSFTGFNIVTYLAATTFLSMCVSHYFNR